MKLEIKRDYMQIIPENDMEIAYIEKILKGKENVVFKKVTGGEDKYISYDDLYLTTEEDIYKY